MSAALHSLGLLPAIAAVVFAAGPVVAAQDEALRARGDRQLGRQHSRGDGCQPAGVSPDRRPVRGPPARRVVPARCHARGLPRHRGWQGRPGPRFPGAPDHPGHPHDDRTGRRSQREHGAREPDQIAQAGGRFVPDEVARGLAGGRGGLQLRGRAALPVHDRPRSGAQRREPPTAGWLYPVLRCRGRSACPARRTDRPQGRAGLDRWRGHCQRVGQS